MTSIGIFTLLLYILTKIFPLNGNSTISAFFYNVSIATRVFCRSIDYRVLFVHNLFEKKKRDCIANMLIQILYLKCVSFFNIFNIKYNQLISN